MIPTASSSTHIPLFAFTAFATLSCARAASSASSAAAAVATVLGPFTGSVEVINVSAGKTTYVAACPTTVSPEKCKSRVQVWTATHEPPSYFGWKALDIHNDDGWASGPDTSHLTVAREAPATVTQEASCSVESATVVQCKFTYSGTGLIPEDQIVVDRQNAEQVMPMTRMVLGPVTVAVGAEKLLASGTAAGGAAASGSRPAAAAAKSTATPKSGASPSVSDTLSKAMLFSAVAGLSMVLVLA